jgi:hypothetical protein
MGICHLVTLSDDLSGLPQPEELRRSKASISARTLSPCSIVERLAGR